MRYLNLIRNIRNWPLHLRYKLGLPTSDPLEFTANNNIRIAVPKRLYHEFKEIFFENAYTVGQQKPIRKTDPTIVDIGANVGFFSMFAMSKYPHCTLYAYEPIEANFNQLQRNQALNADKNFNCYQGAVCGHKGTIRIHHEADEQFTTSATIRNVEVHSDHFSEVPCLRLSDIFDENRIDTCDLLKLDCEGAEFEVLYETPGDYLARIDQIAIEVHPGTAVGENIESLRSYLMESGFYLFQFKHIPHMLWAHRDN